MVYVSYMRDRKAQVENLLWSCNCAGNEKLGNTDRLVEPK